ncbi:hypothetical protein QVD17_22660 [Tagetes erecta]|uniref:Reverse transcriptase zinc-binding domain-containing protein n=1 Tax=Tagetes erecta TaxID=13708 RepID=A0AAD8KD79_TARER|nr:hypothetical protein QVD17_22660 [Tagetes erecta]
MATSFWGNNALQFDFVASVGRSGGLLNMWDPNIFSMQSSYKSRHLLLSSGTLIGSNTTLHILNIYAPQELPAKRDLWDEANEEFVFLGPPERRFLEKLKHFKEVIKEWFKATKLKEDEMELTLQQDLEHLDNSLETRSLTEEEEWILLEAKKNLLELEDYKRKDLCSRGTICHWNWRWKRRDLDSVEAHQLQQCINQLNQVQITSGKDQWLWTKDVSGIFTVSSMKTILLGTPLQNNFILQWNSWVPIKVNIFGWRAEKDRITTSTALITRGIHLESHECKLCEGYEETAEHLLVSCFVAHMVWQFVSAWCHISPLFFFSVRDLLKAHKYINVSRLKKKAIQAIILTACWKIWKTRNEKVFEGKPVNITNLFHDIKSLSFLWAKNRYSCNSISWSDWCDMSL